MGLPVPRTTSRVESWTAVALVIEGAVRQRATINPERRHRIMRSDWAAGWGTLALVNAGLAQSKNRSGFNWFLLSLLLGPIATLLLVLADKR